MTFEESAALFNMANHDHLIMYFMLAFNTVARPEALLELKRFQVANGLIQLSPTGRKQTKKIRPTLPCTSTIAPWLKKEGTSEHFVHWHNKPVQSIKTAFRKVRRDAGLDECIVPYTIHHTVATWMRSQSVDPWQVAAWLGHKVRELKTTECYAKADPKYLSEARDAIDEYFRQLQPLVKRALIIQTEYNSAHRYCVLGLVAANDDDVDKSLSAEENLERETRLELATPTLARLCSTN